MPYVDHNLRYFRENHTNLSQDKFGQVLELNKGVQQSYELNRASPPLEVLERFSEEFGINLDAFIKHKMSDNNETLFFLKKEDVKDEESSEVEVHELTIIKELKEHFQEPKQLQLCDELIERFYKKEATVSQLREQVINLTRKIDNLKKVIKQQTGIDIDNLKEKS